MSTLRAGTLLSRQMFVLMTNVHNTQYFRLEPLGKRGIGDGRISPKLYPHTGFSMLFDDYSLLLRDNSDIHFSNDECEN